MASQSTQTTFSAIEENDVNNSQEHVQDNIVLATLDEKAFDGHDHSNTASSNHVESSMTPTSKFIPTKREVFRHKPKVHIATRLLLKKMIHIAKCYDKTKIDSAVGSDEVSSRDAYSFLADKAIRRW